MNRHRMLHRLSWVVILLVLLTTSVLAAPKVEDFTFLQISDVHAPMKQSGETISQIPSLGEINLQPYNVTGKAPSFVIVTGDITEFGVGDGAWETFQSYCKDITIPTYLVAGNHDNTWDSIRYTLRQLPQGGPYYSFDRFGCHFIGLESATVQEPLPNFPEEEISWLRKDLAHVDPSTPVFVFFHHPLETTEFTSEYDKARLLDTLKGHNIALILGGHSHGVKYYKYDGFDCVLGGSTFGPNAGMAVVSVLDGDLRVAYRKSGEPAATRALLEKPLLPAPSYPAIRFFSPRYRCQYNGNVRVLAWIKLPKDAVEEAKWKLDNDEEGTLELKPGGAFEALVDTTALTRGAHYLTATFNTRDGFSYDSTTSFYYDPKPSPVVWRAFLPGSVKGQVTEANGAVYVGGGDGKLYALDSQTGRMLWSFPTGGEIISQPLVVGDSIYVTSGDGRLYCVDNCGKEKWHFTAGGPIYSSPILSDGMILFGCNDTSFYAVDAVKGTQVWKSNEPKYSIECKPFASDGVVYFGAWDSNIYALNVKDGSLKWKSLGKGSATERAAKYYSPADCGPVVNQGKLFAADRDYFLSIMDALTGTMSSSLQNASGVGLAGDGSAEYLRGLKGDLVKIDPNGNQVWSVPAGLNRVPTAPTESDGVVWVCSAAGLVSAYASDTGDKLLEYRVTPYLFVLSSVEARNGTAYIGGMDGSVTALRVNSQVTKGKADLEPRINTD